MTSPNLSYNLDAIAAEAKVVVASSRPITNYVKLEVGQITSVRFLPPPVNELYPRNVLHLPVTKHFGYVNSSGRSTSISCSMAKYKKCPICDDWASFQRDSDYNPVAKARAKDIKPQHRFIYTVLDSTNTVSILDLDPNCQKVFLSAFESMRARNPSFDPFSLEAGHWVDIKKEKEGRPQKGKFQANVFTVTFDINKTAIPAEIIQQYDKKFIWPEKLNPVYTPEEITKAIDGDWSFLVKDTNQQEPRPQQSRPQPQEVVTPNPVVTSPISEVQKVHDTSQTHQTFPAKLETPRVTTTQMSEEMQKKMLADLLS